MIYQHDGRALGRSKHAVLFLVGAFASTAFIWGSVPLAASAEPEPTQTDATDHGKGNGTHNRNIFSTRSPTHNLGYQHTSTSTAGGATSIQNAMCRNVRVCNITQNVPPRMAETVTPNEADKFTPKKADTFIQHKVDVPVLEEVKTLTPENINPQKADTFIQHKVDVPALEEVKTLTPENINPPHPGMGPFLCLSPLSLMVTVSVSAT